MAAVRMRLRQIAIASSSGRGTYTVTQATDGWECSCPRWIHTTPRRDCKHIAEAKQLPADAETGHDAAWWERRKVLAMVPEVTVTRDAAGEVAELRIPLQPLGPEHTGFNATIAYDLLMLGVPWGLVQAWAVIAQCNPREAIIDAVRASGRVVQSGWVDGRGYTTYTQIAPAA